MLSISISVSEEEISYEIIFSGSSALHPVKRNADIHPAISVSTVFFIKLLQEK